MLGEGSGTTHSQVFCPQGCCQLFLFLAAVSKLGIQGAVWSTLVALSSSRSNACVVLLLGSVSRCGLVPAEVLGVQVQALIGSSHNDHLF